MGFRALSSPRLAREGARQLAPDWWMRGVTRSEGRNAPFLDASRRKVEPKTGWGKGRSPALFKADRTRGSPCLPVVHALAALPVVGLVVLWSDLLSEARAERMVRTCASGRGAPERARRPCGRPGIRRGHASCRGDGTSRLADHREGGGQVTCIGLVGLFGQPRPTVIKVHGPCLPPCL